MSAGSNEEERLRALHDAQILDTPPDADLDDLVEIARMLYGVPIALISLVDSDRQWFKACLGLSVRETPRNVAFCSHAIEEREYLLVPDATLDPRFADNPLVTSDPKIRFYAGVPIRLPSGHALGTFCIIDRTPRVLSSTQLAPLRALARQVESHLAQRAQMRALREHEARERELSEALAKRTAQLEQLLDGISDFVFRTDPAGRVRYANRAAREALGYPDATAMTFEDLVPSENQAACRKRVARLAAGEKWIAFSNVLVGRGGRRFAVEGVVFGECDEAGSLDGLRWILGDVTAQKTRDARLAMLVDELPVGVLVETSDRRIGVVNTALARIFGLEPGPLLRPGASAEAVTRQIAPLVADPARFFHRFESMLRERESVRSEVVPLCDGRVLELDYFPLTVQGSAISEHMFVYRDVTPQRELDRMKDEFISNVSHELRTPLTSIRGVLGLLSRGGLVELPDEARSLLAMADAEANRLARLVDDILDLEKADSRRVSLSMTEQDVEDLMTVAIGGVAVLAAEKGITIVHSPSQSSGRCLADRDRTVQVLVNLLGNAINHSPPGTVVEVSAGQVGPVVRFAVRDNGPGISARDQRRLFVRFQQLGKTRGSGLGLAIAKALVEQQGGQIGVTSEPGKGSEFFITLPRAGSGA